MAGHPSACVLTRLAPLLGAGEVAEDRRRRGVEAHHVEHAGVVRVRDREPVRRHPDHDQLGRDAARLERTLHEQASEITQKLRRDDLVGTTIKLKIRWPDFTTPTRQLTLPQPTDEPEVIIEAALRLFQQIWTGQDSRSISSYRGFPAAHQGIPASGKAQALP